MSFRGSSLGLRIVAAFILVTGLSGCGGSGGISSVASNTQATQHNRLATKVLADIAVGRVRGAMPSKVASRRGRDML